jgi:hypothetical protein
MQNTPGRPIRWWIKRSGTALGVVWLLASSAPCFAGTPQPAANGTQQSAAAKQALARLGHLRIFNAVRLGSAGARVEQSGFGLTLLDAQGNMLDLHQPPMLPDVNSFDPPKPPTFVVVPSRDDVAARVAMPTSQSGTKITPHHAVELVHRLEIALAGTHPKSDGGRVGAFFVERLGTMANEALGSREAQVTQLTKVAEKFDQGHHAAAIEEFRRLAGSGHPEIREQANILLGESLISLGHHEEASVAFHVAMKNDSPWAKLAGGLGLVKAYRGLRQVTKAADQAEQTAQLARTLKKEGADVDLGSALFQLAVMQKNLGKISQASANMQAALAERPDHAPTRIAAAGYLALEGKQSEADVQFGKIAVPPRGTLEFVNYAMNATWYHALKGDTQAVVAFADKALADAAGVHALPGLLEYFNTEADLDPYRRKPEFATVLKGYAARVGR